MKMLLIRIGRERGKRLRKEKRKKKPVWNYFTGNEEYF
jgi:hypothetical protein